MRKFWLLRRRFVYKDHLLGLIEVGNIPVLVYATTEVPCSCPVSAPTADKIKEDLGASNEISPNLES